MPAVLVRPRLAPLLPRPFPLSTRATGNTVVPLPPDAPFPYVRVFIAPGADPTADPVTFSWVEVTADVRVADGIAMKHGRGAASIQAEPSSIQLTLDNRTGDYTSYLPGGRYYPSIQRGLPVRVYVSGSLRATGYVDDFTPGWDTTANNAVVRVSAGGRSRRYGQGTPPDQSLIYTWNSVDPRPVAYWPLEDSSGSLTLQEVIGGGSPIRWSGSTPTFGSDHPDGSAGLVKLETDTALRADVNPYTTAGTWSVVWLTYIPAQPVADTVPLFVRPTGTIGEWRIFITVASSPDQVLLQAYDSTTGSAVVNTSTNFVTSSVTEPYGRWLAWRLTVAQNGANLDWTVSWSEMTGETTGSFSGSVAGTNGNVQNIYVSSWWDHNDWLYGHLALYDSSTSYPVTLLDGYAGETASTRISEALQYYNEAAPTVTGSTNVQTLGPWPRDDLLGVLKDCEAADGGILYDTRDGVIGYRSRHDMYNQAVDLTLNMTAGQVALPFQPTDDDQNLRNEWQVKRSGGGASTTGSGATYIDTADQALHGRYADGATVNVDTDEILYHQAGWRTNLGTVKGHRFTQLSIDLARNPGLAAAWVALVLGDRVSVTNPMATFPPGAIDVLLTGYLEEVRPYQWRVTANCRPALPWDVFTVGSATLGRAADGTSSLAAAVTSSATSLSVASPSATDLWTTTATYPTDFPFDVEVGGERMTVTAIVGATSPQTFTVTRSVNTVVKAHQPSTRVRLWRPAPIGL